MPEHCAVHCRCNRCTLQRPRVTCACRTQTAAAAATRPKQTTSTNATRTIALTPCNLQSMAICCLLPESTSAFLSSCLPARRTRPTSSHPLPRCCSPPQLPAQLLACCAAAWFLLSCPPQLLACEAYAASAGQRLMARYLPARHLPAARS